jgi:thiol-disulfide isomerase/thioredoxin
MLKKYFKKKSKLGIVIDILIVILFIFILIPATRKQTIALILKPTLFIHQPKVNKEQPKLLEETYNWELRDITGEYLYFNKFRNKVVFINLWATWCPPCVAELPDLQKLYNDYNDKVEFLFISNESKSVIDEFMKKSEFDLPVYIPVSQYPTDFETNSIPTSFLINKNGEVVISRKGVAKWNSKRIRGVLDVLTK